MNDYDRESPNQHCPTCGRIPVTTKTWNKLTAQDDLIRRLQLRIKELEGTLEKQNENE